MATKISALALIASVSITDVDVLPIVDIDGGPATTYGVQIGQLRTALTTPTTDHTGSLGNSTHRWIAVHADQLNVYSNGGLTSSTPGLNLTQTWNAGGVGFTALLVNVTNTASASASLLADLQVGGISQFSVDKVGNGRFGGSLTVNGAGLTINSGGASIAGAVGVSGAITATGNLSVAAAAFSGAVTFTGDNTALPGSIVHQGVNGIVLTAATGSVNDFALVSPVFASILSVPTGTINATFGGIIRNDGAFQGYAMGGQAGVQRIAYTTPTFNFLQANDAFANIGAHAATFDASLVVSNTSGGAIHVVSTGLGNNAVWTTYSNNNGVGVLEVGVEASGGGLLSGSSANAAVILTSTAKPLFLGTNSIAAVQIDTSQNIIINGATPGAKLAIHEAIGGQFGFSIENNLKTNIWALSIDEISAGDGIFAVRDVTNAKWALSITPNTLAAQFAGDVSATALTVGMARFDGNASTSVPINITTTIYTATNAGTSYVVVSGSDGTNMFVDQVAFRTGGAPQTISSTTLAGGALSRTYFVSANALRIQINTAGPTHTLHCFPVNLS